MLRIHRIQHNGSLVLKLEGKVVEPWTSELLAQLPSDPLSLHSVRLNLAAVSFIDATATAVLRQLVERGVVIEASSSFVAELLHTREA